MLHRSNKTPFQSGFFGRNIEPLTQGGRHGTHTFLECSDDQCSIPLRRNDDLHLRRSSETRAAGYNKKSLPEPFEKMHGPETVPCIFRFGE
jgi:hypothetical protein